MNGDENELQDLFVSAVMGVTRHFVISDGTISSVDQERFTCEVNIGGSIFHSVPIKVLINTQASVIEMPSVGAHCLMMFRDGNLQRPQLLWTDKSDKFLINSPQVIFHGGNLGGMVKAKELKTESNKDKEILQALLDILTGPPINEPGNGAPSALQAALKAVLAGKTPGTWDNLENPTITQ